MRKFYSTGKKKRNTDFSNMEIASNFHDIDWLKKALTHSSYIPQQSGDRVKGKACYLSGRGGDNERLEFLGDAVLDAVISKILFDRISADEGDLSKLRSQIVCEHSLANIARDLEVGDFLLLGRSVEQSGGRDADSILSDAVEAIIGALFIDSGYEACFDFAFDVFEDTIDAAIAGKLFADFKSEFQEYIQSSGMDAKDYIRYNLVDSDGPDHAKTFFVELLLDGKKGGRGKRQNKKRS